MPLVRVHELQTTDSTVILSPTLFPDEPRTSILELRPRRHKHDSSDLCLWFVIQDALPQETTHPDLKDRAKLENERSIRNNAAVSLSRPIANMLQLSDFVPISLEVVPEPVPDRIKASHVEIFFRDQYVGRVEQHRVCLNLIGKCVVTNQALTQQPSLVKSRIGSIYVNGVKKPSGYIDAQTKIIFRSESAKYYIFLQVSSEMFNFDADGSLFYEKALDLFLPDLFAKWKAHNSSHIVSIVLFARILYAESDLKHVDKKIQRDENGQAYVDLFRVVVDLDCNFDAVESLKFIRAEVANFRCYALQIDERNGKPAQIAGFLSPAHRGGVLEAANMALQAFDKHYIDRDLQRTGLLIVIITAGTAYYHVNKNLLRLTTERMLDEGVTMDCVSLAKMPLHHVPLFRFMGTVPPDQPEGDQAIDPVYWDDPPNAKNKRPIYVCPPFIDSSFYSQHLDSTFRVDRFMARCHMPQLQVMGTENAPLTIPLLSNELAAIDQEKGYEWQKDGYTSAEISRKRRELYDHVANGGRGKDEALKPSIAKLVGTRAIGGFGERQLDLSKNYDGVKRVPSNKKSAASSIQQRPVAAPLQPTASLVTTGTNKSPTISRPVSQHFHNPRVTRSVTDFVVPSRSRSTTITSVNSTAATADRNQSSEVGSSSEISIRGVPLATQPTPAPYSPALINKLSELGNRPANVNPNRYSSFASGWFKSLRGTTGKTAAAPLLSGAEATTTATSPTKSYAGHRAAPGRVLSPTVTDLRHLAQQSRASGGQRVVSDSSKPQQVLLPTAVAIPPSSSKEIADLPQAITSSAVPLASSAPNQLTKRSFYQLSINRTHLLNPSNTQKSHPSLLTQNERWRYIFPRASKGLDQRSVKHKSLLAPACLPLYTGYLPSSDELAKHWKKECWEFAVRQDMKSMLLRSGKDVRETAGNFIREQVYQRLSQNFQLIIAADSTTAITSEHVLPHSDELYGILHNTPDGAGKAIFMSISNIVHRIRYDPLKETIEVTTWTKPQTWSRDSIPYAYLLRTVQGTLFIDVAISFDFPRAQDYDWKHLDSLIAGESPTEGLSESLRYWRTRFTLLPCEVPNRSQIIEMAQDMLEPGLSTDDEIRLAGLLKLYLTFRNSMSSSMEAIPYEYTTLPPSLYALQTAQEELAQKSSKKGSSKTSSLIAELSLAEVATMIREESLRKSQPERRRWFIGGVNEVTLTGKQIVDCLISSYLDCSARSTAVGWAVKLFEGGHLVHLHGPRRFHDDNSFYSVTPKWGNPITASLSKSRWFRSAAPLMTDTPSGDRKSTTSAPLMNRARAASSAGFRPEVQMSYKVVVDLDQARKSDRAESAVIHFDRAHNPESGFHFQLNWLGTARHVEELLVSYNRLVYRYGLRLIEESTNQIKGISQHNPLQVPDCIKLALEPPEIDNLQQLLGSHLKERDYFETRLLADLGFLLDVEADDCFSPAIDYHYSYRPTKFEHSQHIHKSGSAFVQILGGKEGFLLLKNRPFFTSRFGGAKQSAVLFESVREELMSVCGDASELQRLWQSYVEEIYDHDQARLPPNAE